MQSIAISPLWRRGCHPGRAVWLDWLDLVRDILLSGSDYARAAAAGRSHVRYLPPGLRRGDRQLFEPLYELLRWRRDSSAAPPADLRLR